LPPLDEEIGNTYLQNLNQTSIEDIDTDFVPTKEE